jgi:predicted phage-related endonuclease
VKHSHSQANIRESADFYMAQLQHNLAVTQAPWLWFSVIPGNEEPMTVKVERDDEYIARMTELERQFWWHVTEDVAPDIIPSAEIDRVNALADTILVGGYKNPVSMATHNHWTQLALEYIELKPKADRCEIVNKELKALVPDDCAGAYGHGLTVTRNKKGQLTLRFEKE